MRLNPSASVVAVSALFVISCSSGGGSGSTQPLTGVATVAVSQDATLVPQQTVQLTATPKDATGAAMTGKTATWSSSASAIATVSATGLVTAAAVGTAVITATVDGKSGSATMTVLDGGFIGTNGGTVSALQGAVKLTVPAGALSANTAISVAASTAAVTDPRIVPGVVYDIGPTGTQFGAGVTLALTFDPAKVRSIDSQANLRLFAKDATGKWVPLNAAGTGSVDAAAHVVTGALPHLSTIGVASTSAVQTVGSADLANLPTTTAFAGSLATLTNLQLVSPTTDAFGNPVTPIGTPTVVSSDASKISVSSVGKSASGTPGVTYTLSGMGLGNANITVTADGQSSTYAVTDVAPPSMSIALSSSSLSTPQGTAATGSAQVTITKSFSSPVTLTATSMSPFNVTGSFSPATVPATSTTSALSVSASGFLAPGTYPLTITATSTPPGASTPITATATYTATVTAVTGSGTIASADATKPFVAGWLRLTPTSGWSTLTCTNNACPYSYDPNSTGITFAMVQSLGAGAYHDFVLNVAGDEVPYVSSWFARETMPRGTASWAVSNLPAGSSFTGFIGSSRMTTTTSPYTLNYTRAPLGNQDVVGAQSSGSTLRYLYFPGTMNITSGMSVPPIDLSAPGVAPEMHTLTLSDPFGLSGTGSYTLFKDDLDGSVFTELFTAPFTGTTVAVAQIASAWLQAWWMEGILIDFLDPDGSDREIKSFFASPMNLSYTLGPKIGSLSYVQNNFNGTMLDFSYVRQSAYNLDTRIRQNDLTGNFKLDVFTTGRWNVGSSTVNVKTSDLPSGWAQYNPPPNVEVDFKFSGYGLSNGTPSPSSALGGPKVGDIWTRATSFQYRF